MTPYFHKGRLFHNLYPKADYKEKKFTRVI